MTQSYVVYDQRRKALLCEGSNSATTNIVIQRKTKQCPVHRYFLRLLHEIGEYYDRFITNSAHTGILEDGNVKEVIISNSKEEFQTS